MERVVLRHLKGSKATQVEEFALHQFSELVIGRDPSAGVRFDPEKDDVVGRQHARIARDPNDKYRFAVIDLRSRNGTFVNRKRVTGQMWLSPGDVVQLGAGGPEFQFDIDPLPSHLLKATRLPMGGPGATMGAGMRRNRVGDGEGYGPVVLGASAAPKGEGEAAEKKQLARRSLWLGATAGIVVIVAITAWQIRENRNADISLGVGTTGTLGTVGTEHAESAMGGRARAATSAGVWRGDEVHAKHAGAVVQIDFSWRFVYAPTGGPVFHYHVPNQFNDAQGNVRAFYDDGRRTIPAYIAVATGAYEPYLTLSPREGTAIGVTSTGSGFVVTSEGHILSHRHVAANERAPYQFRLTQTGVAVNERGQVLLQKGVPTLVDPPNHWIPSETKQRGPNGALGVFQQQLIYLYVSFPRNPRRIEAQIARLSDEHDAALIKVNVTQSLPIVKLEDSNDEVAPGTHVFVMGYPAVATTAPSGIWTKEMFNREAQTRAVPDPAITTGTVSRVLRVAGVPEHYQLSLGGAAGSGGNNGGPMFDEQGRVIGIYAALRRSVGTVTFGVPIKYGRELLSTADAR